MRSTPRRLGALTLLALALTVGCEESSERLTLTPLTAPPGGEIPALATAPDGRLVAPTAHGVFALDPERQRWDRLPTRWPGELKPNPKIALEGLARASATLPFASEELLANVGGALWMVGESSPGVPMLLRTEDARRWHLADLPADYTPITNEFGAAQPSSPALSGAPVSPALALRLSASAEALYLIDATTIWRHERPDEAPSSSSWREVSLEGVDLKRASMRLDLPASLRHYLPATPARPYELLTVLADQVLVYRRAEDTLSFVLVHSQPRLDRTLHAPPESPDVYALSHDAVLVARDEGERWDALKPGEGGPLCSMVVLDGPDGAALVVGSEDGSIWRHDLTEHTWTRTLEPDPDGRAVRDLATLGSPATVYAATSGRGVLSSRDSGRTWTPTSTGLLAGRARALAPQGSSGALVAADSGLFELSAATGQASWRRLNARAATSIHNRSVSLVGTRGGDILTGDNVSWTTLSSFGDAPLQATRHLSASLDLDEPPHAITQITSSPGRPSWLASSTRAGVMTSSDGATWIPEPRDPALEDALGRAPLLSQVLSADGTRFALSGASATAAPQVWRRHRGRWSSVHALPDSDARAHLVATPDALWLAHGSTLERSVDGSTWRPIDTPWRDRSIVAVRARGPRLELTLAGERDHDLYVLERGEVVGRHVLLFDSVWSTADPFDVLLTSDHVFALTSDGVFASSLDASSRELPRGASILLVLGVTILLATGGFVVMRRPRS
jgi:hypothetical protein